MRLIKTLEPSNLTERNIVATILFVDIVRSTELLATTDIRTAKESISQLIETIKKVAHDFGGEVIKTQGDGVKIGFGLKSSMEDHALRATYAALKMIRDCRITADESFPELKFQGLRAGIHSGYVIFIEERDKNSTIEDTFGLTTNIAAKLQTSAPIDHVCISETCQKLISENLPAKRFKLIFVGTEVSPVTSCILNQDVSVDFSFKGHSHHSYTSLVGRKKELSEIEKLLDYDNLDGQTSILICGDVGIGKSRIIEEVSYNLTTVSYTHPPSPRDATLARMPSSA